MKQISSVHYHNGITRLNGIGNWNGIDPPSTAHKGSPCQQRESSLTIHTMQRLAQAIGPLPKLACKLFPLSSTQKILSQLTPDAWGNSQSDSRKLAVQDACPRIAPK